MLTALKTILRDNWEWRKRIGHLAIFELIKQSRGTALSWAWLFIKPALFVFVFWFALEIGLRAGRDMNPPFFLWLTTGLIPWFYMQGMLGAGSDLFHRYSYLVNKIKFPISGIPTMYNISAVIVHLGLLMVLFAIYFAFGMPLDFFLLQVPVVVLLMFVFFNMYSLMTSFLSALSKDFANMVKAFITPIFWLSGVLFDVSNIEIEWVKIVLLFNPITFFASAFRDAMYYKIWIWDTPVTLGVFGVVFLATFVCMLLLYKRLYEEVPDAL